METPELPTILAYTPRERARSLVRSAFPKRKWRVIATRDAAEFLGTLRRILVDAALAQEFPSAPFFAITPLRATDAPAVARCAALEFCDVIADGIDDPVARDIVGPQTFSARFYAALADPPPVLRLDTPMQLRTWRAILASAGRPVRTSALAKAAGVSREHLSRN